MNMNKKKSSRRKSLSPASQLNQEISTGGFDRNTPTRLVGFKF